MEIVSDTIPKNPENIIKNPNLLIKPSESDSLMQIGNQDSIKTPPVSVDTTIVATPQRKGDIETKIDYNSQDSMFFDLKTQNLYLYGDSKIKYGTINLSADKIKVNWQDKTIKADYSLDSVGNKVGKPIFQEKEEKYETDKMVYNFQSRKAEISGVITEQDGAFMHGELVKKNAENELFIRNAQYTTCNLAEPHFHIQSNKLKVIPKNKIVSGPLNLRFKNIPTFLWLPFGMFPQPKKKTSGILVPSYGEERQRGFFLKDGGYYFAISDYIDLRLSGDIYSRGGYAVRTTTTYKKRYQYSGNFGFTYNRFLSDDLETPLETNDFWVQWSHRPETKGTGSFSASVNGGTRSFNQNNNQVTQDPTRNINSQFTSNVSYSKTFQGTPFRVNGNLRHRQNVSTGSVDLTLPEVTTSMQRIFPLKKVFKSSKSPFAKLGVSHNFNFRNELSNIVQGGSSSFATTEESTTDTLSFENQLGEIFSRGRFGGRHQIPVSTAMNVFKFFTLSPSVNYEEVWYTKRLEYTYDSAAQAVNIDTIQGFQRLSSYNVSASINTTIYGQVNFGTNAKVQAIRHVIQPSLSFSYRPEFDQYYQTVQINEEGDLQEISQYQGFLLGTPGNVGSRSINASIRNNLEMKVRSKKDTVTGYKKVKILDNFSISSGYNFAAESFNLSNLRWDARTSLFNRKVSINLNGTFDPYVYQLESETFNDDGSRTVVQDKIDKFAWNAGQGLGTLQNIRANVAFSLRPPGNSTQDDSGGQFDTFNNNPNLNPNFQSELGTPEELNYINSNPEEYVDFNIPWSLSVRYNIGRTKTGFEDPRIDHTVSFTGDLSITEKTKIRFTSGYDIERNDFTQTSISVNRDLHCWVMDFSWVPFGQFQSFNASIRVRAALLQDLKLEKRNRNQTFFQ
ncbi:MAG: putative LPS assembly protein LptD [Cyclobacteriaceae bacterium]